MTRFERHLPKNQRVRPRPQKIVRDASGRRLTEGRRQLNEIARSEHTAAQLAVTLDISRSHMSELLSGEHLPSLALACRIFKILGIAVIHWYE